MAGKQTKKDVSVNFSGVVEKKYYILIILPFPLA